MVLREEPGSRSREAAGRRNWPEVVPKKMRGRKRVFIEITENRDEKHTRTGKRGLLVTQSQERVDARSAARRNITS
jgi:hypothetical protein